MKTMVSYYTYKSAYFRCSDCGWKGTGAELETGEILSDVFELDCPNCQGYVTAVAHPTIAEGRANWDKISADEKREIEDRERRCEEFNDLKLKHPCELINIDDVKFTLKWDMEDNGVKKETIITYNENIIFRELSVYEGYERFEEVATILKQRYGAAIKDLIPMPNSLLYLYGDKLSAQEKVETIRRRIFGGGEPKAG